MINYPKLDYPKLDNFNKKLIFALSPLPSAPYSTKISSQPTKVFIRSMIHFLPCGWNRQNHSKFPEGEVNEESYFPYAMTSTSHLTIDSEKIVFADDARELLDVRQDWKTIYNNPDDFKAVISLSGKCCSWFLISFLYCSLNVTGTVYFTRTGSLFCLPIIRLVSQLLINTSYYIFDDELLDVVQVPYNPPSKIQYDVCL